MNRKTSTTSNYTTPPTHVRQLLKIIIDQLWEKQTMLYRTVVNERSGLLSAVVRRRRWFADPRGARLKSASCPACGGLNQNDGFVEIGSVTWAICDIHGCRWLVERNPIRPSTEEMRDAWLDNGVFLGRYAAVAPLIEVAAQDERE